MSITFGGRVLKLTLPHAHFNIGARAVILDVAIARGRAREARQTAANHLVRLKNSLTHDTGQQPTVGTHTIGDIPAYASGQDGGRFNGVPKLINRRFLTHTI